MLKKLLKYDLKSVFKVLVVFYILSVLFAGITRGFFYLGESSTMMHIVGQVFQGATIAFLVNILINTFMRNWVRFNYNVYGDESYLTHTLPVEKKSIYLSKILTALITTFVSVLVIVLSLGIMYYSKELFEVLKTGLEAAALIYDSTVISLVFTFVFVFFLEMALITIVGYVGLILGHKSNNNKMLKSIIISILLFFGIQALTLLVTFIVATFDSNMMKVFTSNTMTIEALKKTLLSCVLIYLFDACIMYFLGKNAFEKGVNVD